MFSLKFTTENVDGILVDWIFNSKEELKVAFYSEDCSLPAGDDIVVKAKLNNMPLEVKTFDDIISKFGIEN